MSKSSSSVLCGENRVILRVHALQETFQNIAERENTKEIGFLLKLSGKPVASYRPPVMKKLDLHSIADLPRFAIREGITPP